MRLIGLTGGISTGKSSVSLYLKTCNIPVIDCDQLARDVVEPGTPALRELVATFGSDILLPNGTLDRKKLGDIVFNDPAKRKLLNAITHPAIRREIFTQVIHYWLKREDLVVVDAPLLIEAGLHRYMAEVVVVYCPEDIQLQRLQARDRLSREDAEARIRSQKPMEEKVRLATRVIDNSGSLEQLYAQLDSLVGKLRPRRYMTLMWLLAPLASIAAVCALLIRIVAKLIISK
ncbi:Dephospho-CoA kinase cab5 [Sorochytrium milnesiophthora]